MMAPVEGRNVRENTLFLTALAVPFTLKSLASFFQIYRLPMLWNVVSNFWFD